jgi:hypothetical protein
MATRTTLWPLEAEARPDQAPVGLIETIRQWPGIISIAIEPVSGTVKLVYDDAQADLHRVRQYLADHGYPTGGALLTDEEAA